MMADSREKTSASSLGFPDFLQTLSVISTVGSKVHDKEEQESTSLDPSLASQPRTSVERLYKLDFGTPEK